MKKLMKEFKQLLREDGISYDPWAVCMSAWFQCAAHLYEKGDVPREWEFKVGAAGNHIDPEDSFTWFFEDKTDVELTTIGNFLYRLSGILKLAGKSY